MAIILPQRELSLVSSNQIRMARAALGWSLKELSVHCSVSARTLHRLEAEGGFEKITQANLKLIKQTLEAHGIEFIGSEEEGPGIRLWHNKS